jgi:hypothetical protein
MYIPVGANAFEDSEYGLPPIELVNWYGEEAPDKPNRPYRLLPTPGLTTFTSGLNGAVRGIDQFNGLLSGDLIVAAGERVYSIDSAGAATEIGTITGTDRAQFAASQSDLVMTAGGSAYVVTSSLAAISFPGASGDIIACAEIGQRHLFLEAGSGRLWYSDTAAPATVPANNFATAESEPDELRNIEVVGDLIYLFGSQSVEIWEYTGSEAVPFRRLQGATVSIGLLSTHATALSDFGMYAVGRDSDGNEMVYRQGQGSPQRVSTATIDRKIKEVTEANRDAIALSAHGWNGHSMIGLHLPGVGDYFYDVLTGAWHRRKEINSGRHLAHAFTAWNGDIYAGQQNAGVIFRLDRDVYTHGGNPVRRVATGVIPVEDGRPPISNLTVETQGGVGLVSGQGEDPQVLLRIAKDGHTFSAEKSRSFGKRGEFSSRAVFGPLGRLQPPAAVVEVAVSDPVPATVMGVYINRAKV